MKRRLRTTLAAAAATVAFGLLASVPAQAVDSLYLYKDQFYQSWMGTFWTKMTAPHNISNDNNNKLSSFKNETKWDVAFYHDKNGKGHCFTGEKKSSAAFFWPSDDNQVSSFFLGKKCPA